MQQLKVNNFILTINIYNAIMKHYLATFIYVILVINIKKNNII